MGKTTEEIIAEVPAEERQRFCQFWTGEPSRPCLATTQTSCRRCRFFTPFIGDKLQILTDAVNRENKRASSLEGQVTKLKKVVNYQRDLLENPMGDLISRQDAKDAIDMALDHIDHVPPWVYDKLLNALNEVPSAEKAQLSGEDATSVCKCPCVYREPCDYCPYHRHGCPAEEGLKDE